MNSLSQPPPLLRMFRPSLLLLLAACLCLASCAKFDLDGDDERPASAPSTVVTADGALHLTAAQQANLGLQVAVVESRKVQATLATVGWLQTRAGSEVIVKSPATGFVVPAGDEQFSLGKTVYAQHELATLEVFLSPQEQATLVTAKEEAAEQKAEEAAKKGGTKKPGKMTGEKAEKGGKE